MIVIHPTTKVHGLSDAFFVIDEDEYYILYGYNKTKDRIIEFNKHGYPWIDLEE